LKLDGKIVIGIKGKRSDAWARPRGDADRIVENLLEAAGWYGRLAPT
jgi:hypothetical protein